MPELCYITNLKKKKIKWLLSINEGKKNDWNILVIQKNLSKLNFRFQIKKISINKKNSKFNRINFISYLFVVKGIATKWVSKDLASQWAISQLTPLFISVTDQLKNK